MVFGKEIGKKGTPHLQGYSIFLKDKRGTFFHQFVPRLAVMTKSVKGTPLQNYLYCTKTRPKDKRNGTPPNDWVYVFGDCPAHLQGDRTDIQEIFELAKTGGIHAVFNHEIQGSSIIKFHSGIRTAAFLAQKPRDFMPLRVLLVGPSGLGKTTVAGRFPKPVFVSPPNKGETTNFDPYDHYVHETLVIDDYKPGSAYKFSTLLKILDSKPFTANVKYSSQQLATKNIIITSNQRPEEWYPELFRVIDLKLIILLGRTY